jgi:UDP-N-acetylmuramate: L-alanyl-gamma-D-glutamyl-meso-diaminopimelate ligase
MVGGARLAIEAGWEVRGSDNVLYPPASHMVEALGVPVTTGYAAANLDWDPDIVLVGNALSRGNPEVEAVLERKLHYMSLPEWLKDVVLRPRRPIVISGTHGKTTTTALAAFCLDRAGMTPGFLIGGEPLDFKHSSRLGPEGAPFVIEGDEYDTAFFDKRAKFLHYIPECAVVTSVEFDHGDIYNDIDEIALAFQRMLRQIPKTGSLILCADDTGAMALKPHAFCPVETYGFNDNADWRGVVAGMGGSDGLATLDVRYRGTRWARLRVPLAGRHNLLNALATVAVAARYGASADALAAALPEFKGVRRRMEIFHEAKGITFIDDFAHHPTAIRETIAAVRMRWPGRRVWALFEPRSNTTATNRFQQEMAEAFASAAVVWLGPVHRAENIPIETRLDRDAIVDALSRRGVRAAWADSVGVIVGALVEEARNGDVVLILSNGAFGGIYARVREAFA